MRPSTLVPARARAAWLAVPRWWITPTIPFTAGLLICTAQTTPVQAQLLRGTLDTTASGILGTGVTLGTTEAGTGILGTGLNVGTRAEASSEPVWSSARLAQATDCSAPVST